MKEKRKRGNNYTTAEKDILLELIKKYQNVIENKETNAHMIEQKRQAWDSVCQKYNAVAMSGTRTWLQLRHLYENLKQRSKKNIAKENKEINRTGGGPYKSTLTEQDAQILAMVGPQFQPLSNAYNDAALYFDGQDVTQKNQPSTSTASLHIITDEQETTITKNSQPSTSIVTSNILPDKEATITNKTEHNKPHQPTSSASTRRVKPIQKESDIKLQCFREKLRNAKLERKYLIN